MAAPIERASERHKRTARHLEFAREQPLNGTLTLIIRLDYANSQYDKVNRRETGLRSNDLARSRFLLNGGSIPPPDEQGSVMSVKMALAKLSAAMVGGAVLGGGAMHVAGQPMERPAQVQKVKKRIAPVRVAAAKPRMIKRVRRVVTTKTICGPNCKRTSQVRGAALPPMGPVEMAYAPQPTGSTGGGSMPVVYGGSGGWGGGFGGGFIGGFFGGGSSGGGSVVVTSTSTGSTSTSSSRITPAPGAPGVP